MVGKGLADELLYGKHIKKKAENPYLKSSN